MTDFGKGSRNYGLVSGYGRMKREYYDQLPLYKTLNRTLNTTEGIWNVENDESYSNSALKPRINTEQHFTDRSHKNRRAGDFSNHNIFMKKKRKNQNENKELSRESTQSNKNDLLQKNTENLENTEEVIINLLDHEHPERTGTNIMSTMQENDIQINKIRTKSIRSKNSSIIRKSFDHPLNNTNSTNKNYHITPRSNQKKIRMSRTRNDGR